MDDSDLKICIQDAMKSAMRAKDKPLLSTIRLIMAEIKQIEVDSRQTPDDKAIIQILGKMKKQRQEAIVLFKEGNRNDLVEKDQAEIVVLESFLPKALDQSVIDQVVEKVLKETQASSPKEMGKVMALLKEKLAGQCDMAQLSQQVKSRLQGN